VEVAPLHEFAAAPEAVADQGAREHEQDYEGNARRALEAAARAAQSMAEEFARAREGAWARPAEPEALLAASTEHDAPTEAAPVKMGDFAAQFITADETAPVAEKPMPAEKTETGPRWFRRRRTQA
jgi:hypothetical protein